MPTRVETTASAKSSLGNELLGAVQYALSKRVFGPNLMIASVVGTLLTIANQFDVILRGPVHSGLFVKIGFNYLIPFLVSSVSAYANRCAH